MGNVRRDIIKHSSITVLCLLFLFSMIGAYLYFLNMSVVQVVLRTEHTERQQTLNAEIADLESRYINAQHEIANRIGNLQAYDIEMNKIFVSREQPSLVLGNR